MIPEAAVVCHSVRGYRLASRSWLDYRLSRQEKERSMGKPQLRLWLKYLLSCMFMFLLAVLSVHADESAVTLKEGEGRALVAANCSMCHSLDYIEMNSVFLDRKSWEASVNKMIKIMGAPLSQEDAGRIIDYLTKYYGK